MAFAKDEIFMRRALELAEKGRGKTSPNPMVGALLVKGDKIIGAGYHHKAGTSHAEVLAIKKAGGDSKGSTLYVTLEPCCHFGHTGPCTEAIIKAGIKKVVSAVKDPNPLVNGKGFKKLKQAGIGVISGVLAKEAMRQNELYFGYHKNKRPYVILKIAQSLDGRTATATGDSKWITSLPARKFAHQLRADVDAVVVGSNTVRIDNPQLTVRHVKGKNPYRVVISRKNDFSQSLRLFKNNRDSKTIVVSTKRGFSNSRLNNIIGWEAKTSSREKIDLNDFIEKAKQFGIHSILVEGGATIATSFLNNKLVDKLVVVTAPLILGEGKNAIGQLNINEVKESLKLKNVEHLQLGSDMAWIGYPDWSEN